MKNTVLLQTSGLAVSAVSTVLMKAAPSVALDGPPGCSDCAGVGRIQLTAGSVSSRTCAASCSMVQLLMPLS